MIGRFRPRRKMLTGLPEFRTLVRARNAFVRRILEPVRGIYFD